MVTRVQGVRRQLRQRLEDLVPTYNWQSITQQVRVPFMPRSPLFAFQVGMFWFSGLSKAQGMALADHHVYVMPSNNFLPEITDSFNSSNSSIEHICQV